MARAVQFGVTAFLVFGLALLSLVSVGIAPLWLLIALLMVGNAGLGIVIPSVMVMALDRHGDIAGLASSLGGTLQMIIAGLSIAAAGPFFDGIVQPMVTAITICAVLAFVVSQLVLPRMRVPA